eukprot:snap_masked-scaffold_1-processed-gene-17.22-mRNA-1 protein AED:1.00 eAED:1.00 QI:0/0/0/0/1/1/2/0/90
MVSANIVLISPCGIGFFLKIINFESTAMQSESNVDVVKDLKILGLDRAEVNTTEERNFLRVVVEVFWYTPCSLRILIFGDVELCSVYPKR